jgi:hypothetical protein
VFLRGQVQLGRAAAALGRKREAGAHQQRKPRVRQVRRLAVRPPPLLLPLLLHKVLDPVARRGFRHGAVVRRSPAPTDGRRVPRSSRHRAPVPRVTPAPTTSSGSFPRAALRCGLGCDFLELTPQEGRAMVPWFACDGYVVPQ